MTRPAASPSLFEPPWYLLGAGNMGLLAAHYLQRAGFTVIVLRRDGATMLERTLTFPDGHATRLRLPCQPAVGASFVGAAPACGSELLWEQARSRKDGGLPTSGGIPETSGILPGGRGHPFACKQAPTRQAGAPIRRLVVACKAPWSEAALAGLPLAEDATVLRLQNGLGSLDGRLPATARMIEVVTASAVKRDGGAHQVVAENDTWMGEGTPAGAPGASTPAAGVSEPPTWFGPLAEHWPNLAWPADFRHRQWHKLVGNAVINPLTALHDVANGRIFQDPALAKEAAALAAEADRVLATLDPAWPGDSLARVRTLAEATAGNTPSMRADMQAGAVTEIDAINGWLLRQADALDLDLPTHRCIAAAIKARHP